MSKTILINAVDRTDDIRGGDFVFVESAFRGQVGIGGMTVDDPALTNIPAMKFVMCLENTASPDRVYSGYVADRVRHRGPYSTGDDAQYDVMLVDINTLLEDFDLAGGDADRPAETDRQRILWLLTKAALTTYGIVQGAFDGTTGVDMDPTDHRENTALDVLEECSEASGKNFFVYNYNGTNRLYYDYATSTNLSAAVRISSVATDVNQITTFAPIGEVQLRTSPVDIYSHIRFIHDGQPPGAVKRENLATEAAFRRRRITVTDNQVRTPAKARAKADRYLLHSASETNTLENVAIEVPSSQINEVRAGMRIEIKIPHLGIPSFTWYRIIRREVTAAPGPNDTFSDVRYRIRLELSDTVKPTSFYTGKNNKR